MCSTSKGWYTGGTLEDASLQGIYDAEGYYVSDALEDAFLQGIYDAEGHYIDGTRDNDWGNYNSQVTFTATETGTYYVAARGRGSATGTYDLSVRDTDPESRSDSEPGLPTDPDVVRAGARFPTRKT